MTISGRRSSPATKAEPRNMTIKIKRVYEQADKNDGVRILVDRPWPGGLKKEKAAVHLWLKEIAPNAWINRKFDDVHRSSMELFSVVDYWENQKSRSDTLPTKSNTQNSARPNNQASRVVCDFCHCIHA